MSESVLNHKGILVVDDEADVIEVLKEEILSAAPKSRIDTATTYEEASALRPHGAMTSLSWTSWASGVLIFSSRLPSVPNQSPP